MSGSPRNLLPGVGAGVLALTIAACGTDSPSPAERNRVVAQELQAAYEASSPYRNGYLNERRVEVLRTTPVPSDPSERWEHRRQLADELLFAGETRDAIEIYEELLNAVEGDDGPVLGDRQARAERMIGQLAIAWLRLGEQQNCLANPTPAACVVPISEEGWHELEEGSRNAIGYLMRVLERSPEDLNSRWLLNLAFMTLGEYPAQVPREWLIEPAAFESEYDIGRFWDIAGHLGVDVPELSGGAITEDFDGDGRLDLMTSSWHLQDQLRLFRSVGDGSFVDVTEGAALTGITGGLNLRHADYDNDGDVDVLVLRGAWMGEEGLWPNSLLRNNGDGTFTDVAEEAGLGGRHPTQTAVWTDLNLDGWLDLYVGNETTGGPRHPAELFLNRGDGTFREVAREAGANVVGFIKGVAAGDVDNDGLPDLYVSRLDGPNPLLMNRGPGPDGIPRFEDVSGRVGVQEPMASFPTWFWDYDNDGWLDLFVAGYQIDPGAIGAELLGREVDATLPRLYLNRGDGTFADVTAEVRLDRVLYAMGSNYGDFDNDGWLDMLVGTGDPNYSSLMPNRAFRNDEGRAFQEVTVSGGFGNVQKGHAVAFGDVDGDGDQDIYMNLGGALEGDGFRNAFYVNPGHGNHWLTLKLRGTRANRMAIGSRVMVVVERPDGTAREIHRVVGSGGSFGSNSLQTEVGLGDAVAIRSVEIRWASDTGVQRLSGLELDSAYEIREGESQARRLPAGSFEWPSGFLNARGAEHEHNGG